MAHLEAYLNIFDKPLHIFYPKANEKKNKKLEKRLDLSYILG